MTIPEFWRPFPEDESVWNRYPNVNIHYPRVGVPTIVGSCERTYVTSQKIVTERMPDLDVSVTLEQIIADLELLECMSQPLDPALRGILHIMWSRKINPPVIE